MNKTLKYLVVGFAALLVLLLIAVGIVAATFDPNDYKPQLIRLVQEKKQRTLTIPGDIKLRFFPKIGAELGQVSISEHKGSAEFASVERAKLSLALIPLLSKQLVVDRVQIDGLRANVRRFNDGSTNYDDFLSKDEPAAGRGGQPVTFDIDSVELRNARLAYEDQQQARQVEIANLNLETGKIANRVPSTLQLAADIKSNQPQAAAKIAVKSGFTLDLDQTHYLLKGLDAELKGDLAGFSGLVLKVTGDADAKQAARRLALDGIKVSAIGKRASDAIEVSLEIPKLAITDAQVSGGKLNGTAKLSEGTRMINASFSVPSFEGTPQAFKLPALVIEAAIRDDKDKLDAKARIAGALSGDIDQLLFSSPQLALTFSGKQGDTALNGSLTTPLTANLKKQLIEAPKLAADFTLPNPGGGTLKLNAGGNASVNLDKKTAAATLNGSLDQSRFNAKLGLADFSPLAYTFDIGVDQIDLDRYTSKAAAGKTPAKAPAAGMPAAEKPMDFSALQMLRANGSVRVGALKVANIRSANVRFDVRAAGGKLDVNPLSANLYGGSATGALSVTASQPARFAVRQTLSNINVGPLLKDAIDKNPIEGRGNVQLDVNTSGATFAQIKKGLNGNARMELRDGAIKGVNIAKAVREAKAKLGAVQGNAPPQGGTGSAEEKTDFSELTGSFRITNGVARNDDLNAKSPLFRIAGAGDINLGDDRLDYLVKATVVSTLQGQGGPELQALRGVTVPVKLSGPFNAIGWRIDFAGIAGEMAKQKVEEKKEEVKAKVQEQIRDKLKGLLGK